MPIDHQDTLSSASTRTGAFGPDTRYFEVVVDAFARKFSLLSFGGKSQQRHYIAVNGLSVEGVSVDGELWDIHQLLRQLFVWEFSEVSELPAPAKPDPEKWLLVDAREVSEQSADSMPDMQLF
ncbi:hypothetical protein [Aliagarivorans taiwanensis]|uniref:hypothetical protein n=1 Tax=Aliagarivorans taiwanensis TaxID=561966 RepID=UPI000418087C|nr:hypothetical protein [Aliagarivorans taiwanensis]